MPARIALITGISGQDGSYLSELLRSKEYAVHGLLRPGEAVRDAGEVAISEADIGSAEAVRRIVALVRPDECYHLAAQTFVPGEELGSVSTNVNGTMHLLEALRHEAPACRLFLAGSSEMFGLPDFAPQNENTPLRPRNVYGATKVAAYHLMSVYRRQYGLFACCGFLYNHESPRRPPWFVTRKITQAAARIRMGLQTELQIGNLDSVRDWGHARDYVRGMWLALQFDRPDDYVFASGQGRTVREFVELAFSAAEIPWEDRVQVVPEFYRPAEPVPLIGCSAKALSVLGWRPEISFEELVREMVEADMAAGVLDEQN
jgi:GDPmannose 4,6-dehydratase